MPIRYKVIILLFAFATIPALLLGTFAFSNARNSLIKARLAQLNNIAELKKDKIETFFRERTGDLASAQRRVVFSRYLELMTGGSYPGPAHLHDREDLDDAMRAFQEADGYSNVILTDSKGTVVYVIDSGHAYLSGKRFADLKAYEQGKKGIYFTDVYLDTTSGSEAVMMGLAPIVDKKGAFLGEIVFEIGMDPIFKFISDPTGLGKTGEALIVRLEGNKVLFLSPLRNGPGAALKKRILFNDKKGYPAQEAARGKSGSGIAYDYSGSEVLAAWRYIPSLRWGLVTKIRTSEAFESISSLRGFIIGVEIVMLVFGAVAALILSRSITGPIFALQKGAESVGRGNLDYRIGLNTKDEMGRLSYAFDDMTERLKILTDKLTKEIAWHKSAEEEFRRISNQNKLILESAGEGIWGLDTQGLVTFVNKAAASILGYDAKELIGKHSHSHWHHTRPDGTPYPSEECPIYMTYKDGAEHFGEEVFWRKDGTAAPVDFTSRPIFEDDRITGAVVTFRDVTGRRRAEEERERLIAELARSNKELEQFAYVASHDLQEPLRMVASYVQLISQDYGAKLDPQGKRYMDFAVDGALRMQKLIEGLLAYSRIGRRSASFLSVDTNLVFSQVVSNLAVVIEETRAVVDKGDLPTVSGDETQLIQLFQNLIGNALKFKRSDAAPVVAVAAKRTASEWVFSVKDNGIGIEPEYHDRIFLIFQRLHTRQKYPGTGIGLALCKRIVERHHGRIWVESVPGEGTTFFFTMPTEVIK